MTTAPVRRVAACTFVSPECAHVHGHYLAHLDAADAAALFTEASVRGR